jgi:hypothetical protein
MRIEYKLFQQFLTSRSRLQVYRTEWTVYAEAENLAGSIDLVLRDPADGSFVLVDWKRSEKLSEKYESFGRFMQPPLDQIPDVQGHHYRLQLNVYKWILETYYDLRVKCMLVVCTHSCYAPDPFVDDVPDMVDWVQRLMRERRSRLKSSFVEPVHLQETIEQVHGVSGVPHPADTTARGSPPVPEARVLATQASRVSEVDDDVLTLLNQLVEEAEEDVPAAARQRRFMPGAKDSASRFETMFNEADLHVRDLLSVAKPDVLARDDSVLYGTRARLAHIRAERPSWSEELCRLGAMVAHLSQARLSDKLHVADSATLLWMMEGERHIRVHKGFCYMYDEDGAFLAFSGTPPERLLARVARFCGYLEGIFRRMPERTTRDPVAALNALAVLRQNDLSEEAFLEACLRASLKSNGPSAPKPLRADDEDDLDRMQEDNENPEAGGDSWTTGLAGKIWKISTCIRFELTGTRPMFHGAMSYAVIVL